MRIPGGDLAPARRRQYGGGYGRRRHRRNQRIAVGLVLLAVGAGAAFLLRRDDTQVPDRLAQATPTPSPTSCATAAPVTAAAALPRPQQVRLALLNGTPRNGLAKTVGDQLAAQGFVVTAQANAPAALAGASVVAYGRGAEPGAAVVARWVLGAKVVSQPRVPAGTVQVTLGSGFHRVATPAEVAAASVVAPAPQPSTCAS